MSTRGVYGFRLHGQDKITYNHSSSSPEFLGKAFVEWIHQHSRAELEAIASALDVVDDTTLPTPEHLAALRPWTQKMGSMHEETDIADIWYTLLRSTQGDFHAWDQGLRLIHDDHAFLSDGLFCEWGYVLDLDTETFEVYVGGTRNVQDQAPRYAVTRPDRSGYWACRVFATFALNDLPAPDDFSAHVPTQG